MDTAQYIPSVFVSFLLSSFPQNVSLLIHSDSMLKGPPNVTVSTLKATLIWAISRTTKSFRLVKWYYGGGGPISTVANGRGTLALFKSLRFNTIKSEAEF